MLGGDSLSEPTRRPTATATDAPSDLVTRLKKRLRADWQQLLRRFDAESDRRGMVLIMSMTMVTVLSGLGSAAVVRTSSDIKEAGAYRIERAVYRLSESGTMAAVALAGELQSNFEQYVSTRSNKLTISDTGSELLDLTEKGSYGRQIKNLGVANYNTEVKPPELSTAVPGYDASKYCFRTFQMITTAQFGDGTSTDQRDMALAGEAGLQAFITVGPTRCGN